MHWPQELVVPPPPCPAHVAVLLDKAVAAHNSGEYSLSLQLYAEVCGAMICFVGRGPPE